VTLNLEIQKKYFCLPLHGVLWEATGPFRAGPETNLEKIEQTAAEPRRQRASRLMRRDQDERPRRSLSLSYSPSLSLSLSLSHSLARAHVLSLSLFLSPSLPLSSAACTFFFSRPTQEFSVRSLV
jgi:hypothetical protein